MTPLKDIVGIDDGSTVRKAAEHVLRYEYSRYPVFGKSMHDVSGIVMSRDILEALTEGKDVQQVSSLVRQCLVVPATIQSDELLVRFRDKRIHLAIVQNGGKTVGLVTLEDVLEELVGKIEDEKDAAAQA